MPRRVRPGHLAPRAARGAKSAVRVGEIDDLLVYAVMSSEYMRILMYSDVFVLYSVCIRMYPSSIRACA